MANYYPRFKFLEHPGASLNVIGVLNTHATPQEAEQVKSSDTRFALEFYRNILIRRLKIWQLKAKPEATTWLQPSDIRTLHQFIFEFIKMTFQHFPKALKHSFKHLTTTQLTATSLRISNSGKWRPSFHHFYAVPELGHCSCRQVTHTWREYPCRTELFTQWPKVLHVVELRQHHIVPKRHVDQKISFPGIEQSLQHHLNLSSRSAPVPGDC